MRSRKRASRIARVFIVFAASLLGAAACLELDGLSGGTAAPGGGDAAQPSDAGSTTTTSDGEVVDAASKRRIFVAVGHNGLRTYSEDDGRTWKPEVSDATDGGLTLVGVACGNGKVVVVGEPFKVVRRVDTTTDLTTWKETIDPQGGGLGRVVFVAGKFFAAHRNGVATSTDGETWTIASAGLDRVDAIAWGGGRFVAVGATAAGGGASISTDGTTWTPSPIGDAGLAGVAYGNGRFVGVGPRGRRAMSVDGVTWTWAPVSDQSYNYAGVTFGNGLFVTSQTATSTDGLTWTADTNIAGVGTYIAFGNGTFVVVGAYGTAAWSTDGRTWSTPKTVSSGRLEGVGYCEL